MADNSFDARSELQVGDRTFEIYRLDSLQSKYDVARLPFSLKVLLENLLRNEDGVGVRKEDVEALASWDHQAEPSKEIAFTPARVVLQDFTGVPCVVDLAAMRDAMADLGGDPGKINPLVPVELVIDHSVQVDVFGTRDAFRINAEKEFERNKERYAFLRWGQTAFEGFKAVPPDTGIVHQVNLEYLSRVVFTSDETTDTDPTRPVLAVSGDGGALYSVAELATARQHDLDVTWLIVDDGGYGILREYMTDAFGEPTATELIRPDYVALAESFGVPGLRTSPETLEQDLAKALTTPGPAVVVLPAVLRMFAPTHVK